MKNAHTLNKKSGKTYLFATESLTEKESKTE